MCDKLNIYQTQTQKDKHCSCILKLLLIKSYQTQTQKDKHCSCILKLLLIKCYQTQTHKDKLTYGAYICNDSFIKILVY